MTIHFMMSFWLFCYTGCCFSLDKKKSWEYMQQVRENTKNHTFLLSYPRSGNTWMRFCLEALTNRPTMSYHENPQTIKVFSLPLGLTYDIGTNLAAAPIWKVHGESRIKKISPLKANQDMLIFIVRDYKTCLLSDLGNEKAVFAAVAKPTFLYFENFKIYETWNPQKRLLIYYEDLVSNPRQTLEKILLFLGEKTDRFDEFFHHFEKWKKLSLEFYDMHVRIFKNDHANLSLESSKKIDFLVEKTHSSLWHSYLSRYKK